MTELYRPHATGFEALEELEAVPWEGLAHAYGVGITGDELHDDVAESLALIEFDPDEAVNSGLFSNICHQGTVYEATAHAVPFLIAVVAGEEVEKRTKGDLLQLLGLIARSILFATFEGSRAGAFGPNVAELISEAFRQSSDRLKSAGSESRAQEALIQAIFAILSAPDEARYEELCVAIERVAQETEEANNQRRAAQNERRERKQETLRSLAPGLVITGRVVSITEYGAFVDIGGIDGLLHRLDIAEEPTEPSDLLNLGDEIRVVVLKFDAESERVALGVKQLVSVK